MTIHEAYKQLAVSLQTIYERREAIKIADMVTEHLTGFSNTSRIIHKENIFTQHQHKQFQQIVLDLFSHQPVQYVLNEAYWFGMKLYVDERVLIPRPETEELIEWILSEVRIKRSEVKGERLDVKCKILDVGTGSGCIAIALKKHLPASELYATDISEDALQVAKRNANEQQTEIHFLKTDITDEQQWQAFPVFDYMVSNPPYISPAEAISMSNHVLKFEPHLALFAPVNNPLFFYDIISSFGLQHLNKNGKLFFEINEAFGNEVTELLSAKGYKHIELKKDLQGKDRMIYCQL